MSALWNFALEFYQQADVKECCLDLQDNDSVDICVLLAVLWLGKHGYVLTSAQLKLLMANAADWQGQMVGPLRTLRRRAKLLREGFDSNAQTSQADIFYQQLKQLELDGEQLTLTRLNHLIESEGWLANICAGDGLTFEFSQKSEASQQAKPAVEKNICSYLSTVTDAKRDSAIRIFGQYL